MSSTENYKNVYFVTSMKHDENAENRYILQSTEFDDFERAALVNAAVNWSSIENNQKKITDLKILLLDIFCYYFEHKSGRELPTSQSLEWKIYYCAPNGDPERHVQFQICTRDNRHSIYVKYCDKFILLVYNGEGMFIPTLNIDQHSGFTEYECNGQKHTFGYHEYIRKLPNDDTWFPNYQEYSKITDYHDDDIFDSD